MIESKVKSPRLLAHVVAKNLRVKEICQPLDADDAVDRGRAVKPVEGILRRLVDLAIADRGNKLPGRIRPNRFVELARCGSMVACGDDDLRVPAQHLLHRNRSASITDRKSVV